MKKRFQNRTKCVRVNNWVEALLTSAALKAAKGE